MFMTTVKVPDDREMITISPRPYTMHNENLSRTISKADMTNCLRYLHNRYMLDMISSCINSISGEIRFNVSFPLAVQYATYYNMCFKTNKELCKKWMHQYEDLLLEFVISKFRKQFNLVTEELFEAKSTYLRPIPLSNELRRHLHNTTSGKAVFGDICPRHEMTIALKAHRMGLDMDEAFDFSTAVFFDSVSKENWFVNYGRDQTQIEQYESTLLLYLLYNPVNMTYGSIDQSYELYAKAHPEYDNAVIACRKYSGLSVETAIGVGVDLPNGSTLEPDSMVERYLVTRYLSDISSPKQNN